MGFTSKSGKFFNNPAVGRAHDREKAKAGKEKPAVAREEETRDGDGDHGPVHKVTMHHPDGEDNPSPGQHHTVITHADGHEEGMDHGSAEEAHAHAGEQMGAGGDDELGGHELGDPGEEDPEMSAETCPECGAEMQGRACPECGYSEDDNAIAGQHAEDSRQ